MVKFLFKLAFKLAKLILPSYINKDLNDLSKKDEIIIGIKYWLSKNSL